MENSRMRLIGSPTAWIEGEAIRQLERAAALPDVRMAVGMPDLHPGKGYPIGVAIATDRMLYPYLVGNDIGCGMGLWRTSIKARKAKPEQLVKRLRGLEGAWNGDARPWLEARAVEPSGWDAALGTIGGGNHFAELQCVHEIVDRSAWSGLNLDEESVVLLIHSGSRGLGESILRQYVDRHKADGVESDSEDGALYMARHDHAVRWAEVNRDLIAARFLDACRADGLRALNLAHNGITREAIGAEKCWLHRKGAAPSAGPVVIPGSRGSFTYIVAPQGDQSGNLWSVAHGAGRKWNRSAAHDRVKARYNASQLLQTRMGSHVICDDKDLLFEEAPDAYKNIDMVIEELKSANLVTVVAVLKPLVTYKVRHEDDSR